MSLTDMNSSSAGTTVAEPGDRGEKGLFLSFSEVGNKQGSTGTCWELAARTWVADEAGAEPSVTAAGAANR